MSGSIVVGPDMRDMRRCHNIITPIMVPLWPAKFEFLRVNECQAC